MYYMEVCAKKPVYKWLLLPIVFAFFFAFSFLLGCSENVTLSFTVEKLTLFIGDSRDIFPYISFTPAVAVDKSVTVSSDGDCVKVDGTTVFAVKEGSARVTASNGVGSAYIDVTCVYRPAGRITVSVDKKVQSATRQTDISPVVFTAELDDYVSPEVSPVWYVDGTEEASGMTFTFNPPDFGLYEVSAVVGEIFYTVNASVYRSTSAHIEAKGELTQNKNYTPVTFIAREDIDTRNPNSVYEWTVNGEVVSSAMIYEFIPHSAGEYKIALSVNGAPVKYGESDFALVSVTGERAPVGTVEFDDVNGVIVTWRDKQSVSSVSITSPDGVRRTFNRADLAHSYRFHTEYFDADGLIEVCAENPRDYTVRLTAEGAGEEFTFTQISTNAKHFLDTKLLCRNAFISSEYDAEMWIKELYSLGESSAVGYIFGLTEEMLKAAVKKASEEVGLGVTVALDGNTVSVNLGEYVNTPTEPVSAEKRYMYSELPHIEYDKNNLRYVTDKSSYKLNIERISSSVTVNNSEQLLLVAMSGYKPSFTAESAASSIFSQAKDILLSIIGYGYDDFKKVHAIYDWLQWVTRRTEGGAAKTCDYVEAYFPGTMTLPEGYDIGAASSKGAAKAFALLCAMEGIPCDIVLYSDGVKTFYRNVVNIDGAYYNVDVYGGKAVVDGVELTSHFGLFTADDENTDEEYGVFDLSKTYYTQKSVYGGKLFDRYIAPEETDYSDIKAAVFGAFDCSRIGEVTIPLVGSTVTVAVSTYGAEISLDSSFFEDDDKYNAVVLSIEKAVKEYLAALGAGEDGTVYKIHKIGRFIHAIASRPVVSSEG